MFSCTLQSREGLVDIDVQVMTIGNVAFAAYSTVPYVLALCNCIAAISLYQTTKSLNISLPDETSSRPTPKSPRTY